MNVSRRKARFVIAVIALLAFIGGTGAASAQTVAEDKHTPSRYERCVADNGPSLMHRCDELAPQARTLIGPAGEQVAVFCLDGEATFSVRAEGPEAVYFADTPGTISCNLAAINSVLFGHRMVMNTGPREGWVIVTGTEWPVVWQCRDGALINVSMDRNGDPALLDHEITLDCGYVPSSGAK